MAQQRQQVKESNVNCALLLVVDKHSKRFVSVYKHKNSYDIPGGKCKVYQDVNESFENCAIRELFEETGLRVQKDKMFKILDAFDGRYRVVTYVTYNYSGNFFTLENHKIGWVPLEYLKINGNHGWKKYNTIVHDRMMLKLY